MMQHSQVHSGLRVFILVAQQNHGMVVVNGVETYKVDGHYHAWAHTSLKTKDALVPCKCPNHQSLLTTYNVNGTSHGVLPKT